MKVDALHGLKRFLSLWKAFQPYEIQILPKIRLFTAPNSLTFENASQNKVYEQFDISSEVVLVSFHDSPADIYYDEFHSMRFFYCIRGLVCSRISLL